MKTFLQTTLFTILIGGALAASFIGGQNIEKDKFSLNRYVDVDSTCLVDAVTVNKFLIDKGIKSRILVFSCRAPDNSVLAHAVTVYIYGQHVFYYDRSGSSIISPTVDINNPVAIVEDFIKYPVIKAQFLN